MIRKSSHISAELKQLELLFINPPVIQGSPNIENLIADNFVEFGASGTVYNKQAALKALRNRNTDENRTLFPMSSFQCRELAGNVYQVTYNISIEGNLSRRSSIWKKSGEQWQILFHQGTKVKE